MADVLTIESLTEVLGKVLARAALAERVPTTPIPIYGHVADENLRRILEAQPGGVLRIEVRDVAPGFVEEHRKAAEALRSPSVTRDLRGTYWSPEDPR